MLTHTHTHTHTHVGLGLEPHNIITSSSVESGIMVSANRLKFDWRALWSLADSTNMMAGSNAV